MRPSHAIPTLLAFALALAAAAPVAAAPPRVPASAFGEGAEAGGEPRVQARLLIHPDDARGERLRVGVLFDLDPGWHLYWRNPGDSGLPTALLWQIDGGSVGPVAWPAPQVFAESDGNLTTYGYAEQVLLASEAQLLADVEGERRVRVDAELLVCEVECVPASFSLERSVARGTAVDGDAVRTLFARAADALPVAPESLGIALEPVSAPGPLRSGDVFEAEIAVRSCATGGPGDPCTVFAPPGDGPILVPHEMAEIALDEISVTPLSGEPHAFLLRLRGEALGELATAAPRLSGVLALQGPDGTRHLEVDLPLSAPSGPVSPTPGALGLAGALALALLGGLILNAMPCVLPVLAIKVCAVAELAHQSRSRVLAHGVAYTAGVLGSMLVLAGLVVGLRAAGSAVGWGFQFQEPLFVAAVSGVLVLFALNLFGVYEIAGPGGRLASLGAQASGLRRSFFDGLLAVVLATPCTAPFLGTAVGFAFASPPPAIAAVFLAIGLGLAAPFLLVTLVPGWSRWVPRSGPWMLKLRAGLGFALLASAVWLVWIFGRVRGPDASAALLAFLLALAFAIWLHAALGARGRRRLRWTGGAAATALAALAVGAVQLAPRSPEAPGVVEAAAYDPAAVRAAVRSGRGAFVYFTADWCLTCKMNERGALADERVRQALHDLDFAVFRADWTRRDDSIRRELARFGRAGVPLYLVYHPDAPGEPILLPELLSVGRVLEALRAPDVRAG